MAMKFLSSSMDHMHTFRHRGMRVITMCQRGTVATYEKSLSPQWAVDWSDERNHNLTKAIVGFELEITRLEGKSKLNQNKTVADQQGVIERLSQSKSTVELQVAQQMAQNLAT